MRRTHKILAATIATIAAVASLAGCTPSSAPAAGGESSGTKTLTVWHYYSVPGQTKGLDSLGQDFEAKHDGVTVKNVYVPFDQLTNKLVQAAGTKSGPDVVVYNAADTYTLDKAGAIAPMDSWWNDFADKDQFPDSVIQKVDGKTLGVQGFVNLIGLWYNKDILDQLGVKPPTTFAELEKDLALAKAAGKEGITLTGKPNSEGEWQAFPWLSRAGWDYAKPEQKPLEDASLADAGLDIEGLPHQGSFDLGPDRSVPAVLGRQHRVRSQRQLADRVGKQSAKFNYGVVPIPVGDKGSIYLGGEAQNIGAFSKNKELAQQYLEQEFFSKQGELTLLKAFGSIPARADVAEAPQVKDDPILSVFSSIVAKNGHASPDRAIPSKNVATVLQTVGESWSAAIAGTGTPDQISSDLLNKLEPLLKQ